MNESWVQLVVGAEAYRTMRLSGKTKKIILLAKQSWCTGYMPLFTTG